MAKAKATAKKIRKKAAKPKTTTAKTKRKLPSNEVLDVTNPQDLNFYMMAERIKAGEYIPAETLARALKVNRHYGNEMPPEVLDYYHDFLLGKIGKPRGRKAEKKKRYSFEETAERMAVQEYRERLEMLISDRKQRGFVRRRTDSQKIQNDQASNEAATWVVNNSLKNRNITTDYFIRNIVPKYPTTKE